MNVVFADSFYFFALLNLGDQRHAKAVAFTQSYAGQVVTTEWIITELADGLAKPSHRRRVFMDLYRDLKANPNLVIMPYASGLLSDGISLYGQRPDKEWTLTDCVSFVVMRNAGLQDALTGDRHFEQAGFVALLK